MSHADATVEAAKAASKRLALFVVDSEREEAERIAFLAYLQGFKAGVESERPLIVRLATSG